MSLISKFIALNSHSLVATAVSLTMACAGIGVAFHEVANMESAEMAPVCVGMPAPAPAFNGGGMSAGRGTSGKSFLASAPAVSMQSTSVGASHTAAPSRASAGTGSVSGSSYSGGSSSPISTPRTQHRSGQVGSAGGSVAMLTPVMGRSGSTIGRTSGETASGIGKPRKGIGIGGDDDDDDDDWGSGGSNTGEGVGGGSSGAPQTPIGDGIPALIVLAIVYIIYTHKKHHPKMKFFRTHTHRSSGAGKLWLLAALLMVCSGEMMAATYQVDVVCTIGGSTSPAGTTTTEEGGNLVVTATPKDGYVFDHWELSSGMTAVNATSKQTTIKASGAGTAKAVFQKVSVSASMMNTYVDCHTSGQLGVNVNITGATSNCRYRIWKLKSADKTDKNGELCSNQQVSTTLFKSPDSQANATYYLYVEVYDPSDADRIVATSDILTYYVVDQYYLRGSFSNWERIPFEGDGNIRTVSITLSGDDRYDYKVESNNVYYGNNGTMTSSNCTNWTFSTAENNCGIQTSYAGTYVFTLNVSTKQVSVTYPEAPYYLRGSWGDIDWNSQFDWKMTHNGNECYVDVDFEGDTDYEFKIYTPKDGHTWYGVWATSDKMTYSNRDWTLNSSYGVQNVTLHTGCSGIYRFTFNKNTHHIVVTYPEPTYYLRGEFLDGWMTPVEFMGTGDELTAVVDFDYDEAANQKFKIHNCNNEWLGANVSITGTMSSPVTLDYAYAQGSGECKISPICAGTYKFIYNKSTKELRVVYPEGDANSYYIVGDFNDWRLDDDYLLNGKNDKVIVALQGDTSYHVYFVNSCSGEKFGTGSTITGDNTIYPGHWASPYTLTTGVSGEYVFKLVDIGTRSDGTDYPIIGITYPTAKNYYVVGEFNDWPGSNISPKYQFSVNAEGTTKLTCAIEMDGCDYTTFMVTDLTTWYGNPSSDGWATFKYTSNSWKITGTKSQNFGLNMQGPGIYTFVYDTVLTKGSQHISLYFPKPYYALIGDFNKWNRCANVFPDNSLMTVYLAESNTPYKMQIISADGLYGLEDYNGGNMSSPVTETSYNLQTSTSGTDKDRGFSLLATVSGYYSFAFDHATQQMTIIYPDAELLTLCKGSTYLLPEGYNWSGTGSKYVKGNTFAAAEVGQYHLEGELKTDLSHTSISIVVEDCPYEYRIKSVTDYGTFYSNVVGMANEELSLYAQQGKNCYFEMKETGADDNQWQTGVNNIQPAISANGIYHTSFKELHDGSDITNSWTKYEGELYVYNAAESSLGVEKKFKKGTASYEYFDHYLVLNNGTGVTMGDKVNTCISYPDKRYSAVSVESGDAVRYIYNSQDNHFQRTILRNPVKGQHYLVAYGDQVVSNEAGSGALTSNTSSAVFSHLGNYIYEVDFWSKAGSSIHLAAEYDSKWQYLLDKTGSASETVQVLGYISNGPAALHMHVYYDFKTNRILSGWMPTTEHPYSGSTQMSAECNLFVKRTNETAPKPFEGMTGRSSVSGNAYFIQEFDPDNFGYNLFGKYFFFALPYAAKVSDVFGLEDHDYKRHWTIQRYRGDKRAQFGTQYESYWANMNTTATLQPARGYEIGVEALAYYEGTDLSAATWNGSEYTGARTKRSRRVFIPTASSYFTVLPTAQYEGLDIAGMPSELGNGEANWNVLGAPGFCSAKPMSLSNQTFVGMRGNKYPNYVYTWNGGFDDYTVQSIIDFEFEPTMSYFVQYEGSITWQAMTSASPVVRKAKASTGVEADLYAIALENGMGEMVDHTYISRSSDAEDDYELGCDLEKIRTAAHGQLYTLGNNKAFAAQDVTRATTRVPLTMELTDADQYTIALEKAVSTEQTAATICLYDSVEQTYTNLLTDAYTFTGSGTQQGRFYLLFGAQVPSNATSLDEASDSTIGIADGVLFSNSEMEVYDMLGRQLGSGKYVAVPAGVYLVRQGETVTRVLVR